MNGGTGRLRLGLFQPEADGIADGDRHRNAPVAGVVTFDDLPGRQAGAGLHDRALGGGDELIVQLPVPPVALGNLPVQQRILFQLAQALLLCVLGQMHPEFQDQRAIVGQGFLERFDPRQPLVELGQADAAVDMVENRHRIPGTEKQGDAPLGRQLPPEPPVFRPVALLVGKLAEGAGNQPARIHPLVQFVDRFAFTGAVHTGEYHDHRKIGLPQLHLHHQQLLSQLGNLLVIIPFGQLALQFGGSKHHDLLQAGNETQRTGRIHRMASAGIFYFP